MSDLVGKIIGGRYRVETFLGKGGMAEVYKVWDQERNVHLAMKILHADLAEDKVFLRRFKREAQTLATLQHPNIVRFYGMEQDDDLVYMLMDYVEGTTLRKEIFKSKASLSLERIQEVVKSVCAALYYAHKFGFVHCDVKPANIMIHNNGMVYVSDFGIARMTEASTVTMVGAGTPAYMSPEQVRGEDPTPQMDIYALGVVLFEMLTGGERPFTGENAKTTGTTSEKVRWEQMRLVAPPPSKYNPSIPSSMDAIVLKCLDKSPVNRYLSAMDLYGDLITLESTSVWPQSVQQATSEVSLPVSPISYLPHNTANPPQKIKNKRKLIGIATVAIGLLLLTTIIVGNAKLSNQQNLNDQATIIAEANNVIKASETKQASYLLATAAKQEQDFSATATVQEQNTQATVTRQSQNQQSTATALAQNAKATAASDGILEMVPGNVLSTFKTIQFFENFDKTNNGWHVDDSFVDNVFFGSLEVSSGKYTHNVERIIQNETTINEEIPNMSAVKNFYFQADMSRIKGSGAWSCYGLRFRDTGEGSYDLEVCDDRYYQVRLNLGRNTSNLVYWTTSSKILSGETNRIGVAVSDRTVDIYINGSKIYSFESSYILDAGKLGLIKILYSFDPAIFEYDNVIILVP
jgi:serine/threonine protein kinase